MPGVVYQQAVDTTDGLLKKWPKLAPVVTVDEVRAGLSFYKSKSADDFTVDKPVADEAVKFYNAVIADGRYVDLLAADPVDAAAKLGVDLSSASAEVIRRGVEVTRDGSETAISPGGVVVAVVIVIVLVANAPEPDPVVIDESGLIKL